MKAKYQITQENYIDVMRLVHKRKIREQIVFGFLACALAALAIYNFKNGFDSWSSWILIAIVTWYFATPFVVPFIARRTYRKYESDITQEREIELSEDGIVLTTADTSNLVRWDKIKKWRHNNNYILVYVLPQVVHIIPKSLSQQGFDIDRLTEILNQKIGKAK